VADGERPPAAVLAAADRQLALVNDTLAKAVEEARELLLSYGATEAWALLASRLATQLGCTSSDQQFAAEMLAAAAVQLAGKSTRDGVDEPTGRHTEPSPVYAYGCADCPYKETEAEAVERNRAPCPECGGPMLSRE
jgi:hypothetical protein